MTNARTNEPFEGCHPAERSRFPEWRWMRYLGLIIGVGFAALALASEVRADLQTDQVTISAGVSGIFDTEHNPTFIAEYRFARNWHGIHPWTGLSWATDGAIFAGGGILISIATEDDRWSLAAGSGPGYYERHQGADLGSHLEFCSFGEISRNLPSHRRVMLRLMHISNGGITERNPGNELLLLGYAIPLP